MNINGTIVTTLEELEAAIASMDDASKIAMRTMFTGGTPTPSVDTQTYVTQKVIAAMEFGRQIMAEYGASNVIAGMTVAQVQEIMAKTAGVQGAILSGSLHVALDELSKVPVDGVLITTDRIATFRHKIQTYLGIPLT